MNCDEIAALLGADADGEVDALRSHAIRKHVASCPLCGPRRQAVLEMQRRLRAELPRHAAPPALREHLLGRHAHPPAPRPERWRWFGTGAAAGALAAGLLAWLLTTPWPVPAGDLSAQVVALHSRATLGGAAVEVASSDQHRVKPWLSARLDYSIPVVDAAAAGFPLLGARIDRLDGRAVATLVYRRRDHLIDVFVRPEADVPPAPPLHAVRGFNVVAARGGAMEWIATSDLNPAELAPFVQGLARGTLVAE